MRISRSFLPTALAMLLVAGAAPTTAAAVTQTATSDGVTATVSFREVTNGQLDQTLSIQRRGVTMVDGPLVVLGCGEPWCTVEPIRASAGDDDHHVIVRDLDHNGEPEVLVQVVTNASPAGQARLVIHALRGGVYRRTITGRSSVMMLRDLGRDRKVEVLTSDDRVGNFLAPRERPAWTPVQVLRFSGGRMVDVSVRFPAQLRSDAVAAMTWARMICRENLAAEPDGDAPTASAYASWAADQYRLGHRDLMLQVLRREVRRGCLVPDTSSTFVGAVDRYLRRIYG